MSLLNFYEDKIAIDLGTSNTLITHNGKIAINHPSIVAIHRLSGKILACGREALAMRGKVSKNSKIVSPCKDGVIANFDAAEKMLSTFIHAIPKGAIFKSTSYHMIIAVPCESTSVERRAVKESAKRLKAKKVYLIPEPIAAAIGGGLDILQPKGHLIVDIGGGTTEIAVVSYGAIIRGKSLKVAGNLFTNDIINYIREQYNLVIGESTAEHLKTTIGSAMTAPKIKPRYTTIQGRELQTGLPKEIKVSDNDIAKSLDKSLTQIEKSVLDILSETPPEIAADIYQSGIYLTGGGSLLKALDDRLSKSTDLPVCLGDNPLEAVVKGSEAVLKNLNKYKIILRENIED
ncbi:rod shape-determining protein [Aquimarina brevivitae]|uniref:Cell shape-determining protein MreB n=1 Tax=Aquimarina brevivitae TaxID=323412 RepID=A0A4Q7NTZ3_9FLAO|nr:rod shape-determining protein [Aquimarina brevivitae]RZS90646.1 rod shape-determining protein MreB [Aquimarina brevivitae]